MKKSIWKLKQNSLRDRKYPIERINTQTTNFLKLKNLKIFLKFIHCVEGYPLQQSWTSFVAQLVKNPPAMRETWVQSLGWKDPLEKGKATHSSVLAWRILWTIWSLGPKESDTTEPLSLHSLQKTAMKLKYQKKKWRISTHILVNM